MNWGAFRSAIAAACSLFLDGDKRAHVQYYEAGDVRVVCVIGLVESEGGAADIEEREIADWSKPIPPKR